MQLYRLMLVDDEEELRRGVIRRIDWEGNGFTVVGEAENGEAGLELAEQLQPDVILTDIKMPFMDGLTMSRQILDRQPGVKIIMLSGFDDFEYAQEAIAIGSMDYILKPINAAELTETLCRVRARLDEEMREKHDLERLRMHYQRSLPILREQLLQRLLDGTVSAGELEEQAHTLSLDLEAGCYAVVSLCGDPAEGQQAPVHPELMQISLRELAEGELSRRYRFECVLRGGQVYFLLLLDHPEEMDDLIAEFDRVCYLGRHYYKIPVTAGLGLPVTAPEEIYRSAQGAREAMEYRTFLGGGRSIYIQDVEPDPNARFVFDEQSVRELVSAVRLGQEERIVPLVRQSLEGFGKARLPVELYRFYVMSILTELVKLMQVYQIPVGEILSGSHSTEALLSSLSPDALVRQLAEICTAISQSVHHGRANSVRSLTDRAKQYIAAHYQEPDLSVDRLCAELHISPSYFSTVFKRESGETFVSYLTRTRMEQAAELLRTTDEMTYVIAEQVGIAESNYFSYVFKKHFGVSPSKYREKGK